MKELKFAKLDTPEHVTRWVNDSKVEVVSISSLVFNDWNGAIITKYVVFYYSVKSENREKETKSFGKYLSWNLTKNMKIEFDEKEKIVESINQKWKTVIKVVNS